MTSLIFITHPEVSIEENIAVTDWGLSPIGQDRAERFAASDLMAGVGAIWASSERKAQQSAACFAAPHELSFSTDTRLGENDRSSTGFLPREVFEVAANAFFANPDVSYKGWERATDAQVRIERAVREIVACHKGGNLAIVSHGAVGTLLYCALKGVPIDREHDQPGQGHYWSAGLCDLIPRYSWKSLD